MTGEGRLYKLKGNAKFRYNETKYAVRHPRVAKHIRDEMKRNAGRKK